LVSLNQRPLSSAFVHQALLLRPIHSNLPGVDNLQPDRRWRRSVTAMCSPTFGTRPRPKGSWRTRVHRPWSTFTPSSAA